MTNMATNTPRLALVVQRYGLEVNGGSEAHCRQVTERLVNHYPVQILTTCAQDYTTWDNVYEAGEATVNNIPVRRFPVLQPRDPDFGARSARLYSQPHTLADEFAWLRAQGPLAPDLLRYIAQHHLDYDAFIFFTYIYYPTALGVRLVADRALLVPTAHDEPPLYLNLYKALFHAPRAILYNTQPEKEMVEDLFENDYIPSDVVGVGLEMPTDVSPARFRQKYQLEMDYILYVGRVSHSKNCAALIDHFIRYKADYPSPLKLILIGHVEFPLPDHPDLISLGFVSDEDKFDALAGATIYVHPSKLESLSMIILESLALGTPVLCDGSSPVLRGHCTSSNAGLYYHTYPEFAASLNLLLQKPALRQTMGQNGKTYVEQNYLWAEVIQKYKRFIAGVVENSHL